MLHTTYPGDQLMFLMKPSSSSTKEGGTTMSHLSQGCGSASAQEKMLLGIVKIQFHGRWGSEAIKAYTEVFSEVAASWELGSV